MMDGKMKRSHPNFSRISTESTLLGKRPLAAKPNLLLDFMNLNPDFQLLHYWWFFANLNLIRLCLIKLNKDRIGMAMCIA